MADALRQPLTLAFSPEKAPPTLWQGKVDGADATVARLLRRLNEKGVGLPGGMGSRRPGGAAQGALPLAALASLIIPTRGEIRHFWRG